MSRNFGIGSRCLISAGHILINQSNKSFSSKATLKTRWKQFATWGKEHKINKLEKIHPQNIIEYADYLNLKISNDDMAVATAQNYISAINSVMALAIPNWISVSPTIDGGLPKRMGIASSNKATSEAIYNQTQANVSERLSSMMALQHKLGLRFKESALIDAQKALFEAQETGFVTIDRGTKGGRCRRLAVSSCAILALEQAAAIQDGRSMVPCKLSYQQFQRQCYAEIKNLGLRFHGNRHHYAQRRYAEEIGAPAPVVAGWPRKNRIDALAHYLSIPVEEARVLDHQARLQVAEELGHGRMEVSNAYLG